MFASKMASGRATRACTSQPSVQTIRSVSVPADTTRLAGCRLKGAVITTVRTANSAATRQIGRRMRDRAARLVPGRVERALGFGVDRVDGALVERLRIGRAVGDRRQT